MSVLGLDDAKAYLRMSSTENDAELQTFIDAAEAALARRVGPLAITSVTERVRGWRDYLHVTTLPAVALTSVTPVGIGGAILDANDLYLDAGGVIQFVQTGLVTSGYFYAKFYDVVYTAGRAVTTTSFGDLYMAIRELVRHLWTTQRGSGTRRPGNDPPERRFAAVEAMGAPFMLPNRVIELIGPYVPSGIA